MHRRTSGSVRRIAAGAAATLLLAASACSNEDGLLSFFSQHDVAWGPLMAGCVIFTAPAVLIFLLAQRYFVGDISTGAFK
jgi:ABC-type glycerol-3-phosphate transport system permease component